MAKTPNLQITLLEVGQNDKELTINEAISTIDTAYGAMNMTGYLGEFSSAPSTTGLEAGSSYYDLTFQVFKTLNTSGTWVTSSGGSGGGSAGVDSVNGRSGVVTIESTDVIGALGFTPYNATNPSGYISSVTGDIAPNKVTIGQATGSDGLVFINGSVIKLTGTDNATMPYFQTAVTNGTTSIRARGNGTGGAQTVVMKGGDPVNQYGQAFWADTDGYGIYAFQNGTASAPNWYLASQAASSYTLNMLPNGNLNVGHNLTLTGAGKAIQGDFSNATVTDRNFIQTSTVDGRTSVVAYPNGTETRADLSIENSSGRNNAGCTGMGVSSSESWIASYVRGTGTALPLNVYSSNNTLAISIPTSGHLVLPKTSGMGIKVDSAAPTYAWQDLLGPIMVRGTGIATDPTLNTFRNNLRAYQFTVNDYVEVMFHLGHDYVPGSDVYMHVHWGLNTAGTTSGGVTWEFETTYAKGHNQEAFLASKITTVTQAASTVQYQHMIAETPISSAGGSATLIDNALFEPDGIFMIRVRLTGNTVNGGPEPFAFLADMHYQSTGIGTKNKSPSFYA
jgi:hypothetical protein